MDDNDIRLLFQYKLARFRARPSFNRARDVWLDALFKGFDVPDDIMAEFVKGLVDQHDRWEEPHFIPEDAAYTDTLIYQMVEDILIRQQSDAGKTNISAALRAVTTFLTEEVYKDSAEPIDEDAVKKKYYRYKEKSGLTSMSQIYKQKRDIPDE